MREQQADWGAMTEAVARAGVTFEEASRRMADATINLGHAYYGGHYFQRREEGGGVACAVCGKSALRESLRVIVPRQEAKEQDDE